MSTNESKKSENIKIKDTKTTQITENQLRRSAFNCTLRRALYKQLHKSHSTQGITRKKIIFISLIVVVAAVIATKSSLFVVARVRIELSVVLLLIMLNIIIQLSHLK
jgi:hypothetical protein